MDEDSHSSSEDPQHLVAAADGVRGHALDRPGAVDARPGATSSSFILADTGADARRFASGARGDAGAGG